MSREATSNNDIKLAKIMMKGDGLQAVFKFSTVLLWVVCILVGLWMVVTGTENIVGKLVENEVSKIKAIALVLEYMPFGFIVHLSFDGLLAGGWFVQWRRTRNLVQQKAELQQDLEREDPGRTSSELNITGTKRRKKI